MSPNWDQILKYVNLWRVFLIQTPNKPNKGKNPRSKKAEERGVEKTQQRTAKMKWLRWWYPGIGKKT